MDGVRSTAHVPIWKPDPLSPARGNLISSLSAEPYSSAPCSSPELLRPSATPGDTEQFRGVEGNKAVLVPGQWQGAGAVPVLSPPPHLSTLLLLHKPAAFSL